MNYLAIYIKGLMMGAADIIPGISGGTIAFITGIYDELLESISNLNFSLLKTLKNGGIKAAWKKINGSFLLTLGLGLLTAVVSLAKVVSYLLLTNPILVWAFFFGLIIASIFYVGKDVKVWNAFNIILFLIGTTLVIWLSTTPPLSPNDSLLFLFFAGALAICAMILPGISGSFILLLLGAYSKVLEAVSEKEIATLLVIAAGSLFGLLAFSNFLKMLFKKKPNQLISFLVGLLVGSLWKLWPWKTTPKLYIKGEGVTNIKDLNSDYNSIYALWKETKLNNISDIKPYIEENVLPSQYSFLNNGIDNQLIAAISLGIAGFLLLFLMERIALKKDKK